MPPARGLLSSEGYATILRSFLFACNLFTYNNFPIADLEMYRPGTFKKS